MNYTQDERANIAIFLEVIYAGLNGRYIPVEISNKAFELTEWIENLLGNEDITIDRSGYGQE